MIAMKVLATIALLIAAIALFMFSAKKISYCIADAMSADEISTEAGFLLLAASTFSILFLEIVFGAIIAAHIWS